MITKPKSIFSLKKTYIEEHEQEPSKYELLEMDMAQRGISIDDWNDNEYKYQKMIERRYSDEFEKLTFDLLKHMIECENENDNDLNINDEIEIEMFNVLYEAATEPFVAETKRERIETVASWYPDFKINSDDNYHDFLSRALAKVELNAEVLGI